MSNAGAFILRKNSNRDHMIDRICAFLKILGMDKDWEVKVERKKRQRSLNQNAYLWGCVYPEILKQGGETLGGWTADDLHEFFLGKHFGVLTLEFDGETHEKPMRRSSKLSTLEFMDYVSSIQIFCVQRLGIHIPDPDPEYWSKAA